jgi:hypothetical protein
MPVDGEVRVAKTEPVPRTVAAIRVAIDTARAAGLPAVADRLEAIIAKLNVPDDTRKRG